MIEQVNEYHNHLGSAAKLSNSEFLYETSSVKVRPAELAIKPTKIEYVEEAAAA